MSPSGGLPSPRMRWGPNSPALENVIVEGSWRKRDEKKEDTPTNASTLLDHNTFNAQVDGFTDRHIDTIASSGESISGSDRDIMSGEEVQTELENSPSFGDVLNKHIGVSEVDDYGTSPLKVNDGVAVTHPPGFDPDPAGITWLYRDPKGNIQGDSQYLARCDCSYLNSIIGPFSASLMQKWYDEGYFAPDLLVKRFQLDNKWIMVGDLAMHTRNGKLFIQLYPEDLSSGFFAKSSLLPDPRPFNHFRQPLVQSDSQMIDHSIHQSLFQHPNATDFGDVSNSYASIPSGSIPVPQNPNVLAISPSQELAFPLSNRATVLQPAVSGSADFEHSLAYRDDNEFPHSTSMDQVRTLSSTQAVYSGSESFESTWSP